MYTDICDYRVAFATENYCVKFFIIIFGLHAFKIKWAGFVIIENSNERFRDFWEGRIESKTEKRHPK